MNDAVTTILNRREEFSRVAESLDRLAGAHHLAAGVVADMQVALDEILTNITNYGYTDGAEHEIRVRFRVLDDALEVIIEDDGKPFNPLEGPTPDTHAPLRERKIGGVGLHFVRNLMSEVHYDRVGDRNRLVLRRELTP
jgi:anti-sigma regulatory factor (Ser/Thr protein kinase)